MYIYIFGSAAGEEPTNLCNEYTFAVSGRSCADILDFQTVSKPHAFDSLNSLLSGQP